MNDRPGQPLLLVRDLRTWFPIKRGVLSRTRGHVRAVDGVSLEIARGETLGLVGESGCGKTTLGRTLLRLEDAAGGRIEYDGIDLLRLDGAGLRACRRRMQMIFQDPYSSLNPRMTLRDIVTEGMIEHGLLEGAVEDAAIRLLHLVGLDRDHLYRYPHEFSGGQRQRISVARALSVKPEFVVCDEAVSALDVSVQAQVINLLMDLRDQFQLSYLFISHDLSVVRHIADRVAVMYLGKIVEVGPTSAVIQQSRHPYTQALISAVPVPGGAGRHRRTVLVGDVPSPASPPSGCRFHTRCPRVMPICRRVEPPSLQVGSSAVCCHLYDAAASA